jgi:hypothetical protein
MKLPNEREVIKMTANFLFDDDFRKLTDNDLITLASKIQIERDRRKAEKKEDLIEDFRQAFQALINEGIDVMINDDYIANFDSFEFY